MGTLLAQLVTDAMNGRPNRAFFQERLLDDLIYQSILRWELNETLKRRGQAPYSLRDQKEAEEALAALCRQKLPGLWPLKTMPPYRVSLPWSRTFEVRAEVEKREASHDL